MSKQPLSAANASESDPVLRSTLERRQRYCQIIIVDHAFWSALIGLMPLPILDSAVIMGIQLKMINELSAQYDQPFSRHRSRAIITGLLSGFGAVGITSLSLSFTRWIPGLGTVPGLQLGLISGGVTYAVGRIFVDHFENGGEIHDLDPTRQRDHFQRMYEEGQAVIRRLGRSAP